MTEETFGDSILEKIKERTKRRSAVVWSGTSIAGYIWDIIRNIIVILIVLAIYNSIYDSTEIIIVSILILIYLSIVGTGAQLGQSQIKTSILNTTHLIEILKEMGKTKESEEEEIENAEFLLEKIQYKFILNSVFNFIIFVIVFFNLISAI
jgi:hypothetical protein